jgi:hypothetical protein
VSVRGGWPCNREASGRVVGVAAGGEEVGETAAVPRGREREILNC